MELCEVHEFYDFVILGYPEMHAPRARPGPAQLKDLNRRILGTHLSQGKGGGGGFLVKGFPPHTPPF